MSIARREFVRGMTAAGAAGLVGLRPESVAAEPPPRRLRSGCSINHSPVSLPSLWRSPSSGRGIPPCGVRSRTSGTEPQELHRHAPWHRLRGPKLWCDRSRRARSAGAHPEPRRRRVRRPARRLHAGCYKLLASERFVRSETSRARRWPSPASDATPSSRASCHTSVSIPARHRLGSANAADSMQLFADGCWTHSWLCAGTCRTAGAQGRARPRRHPHRQAMVRVLLLHPRGNREFVRKTPWPRSAPSGPSSRPTGSARPTRSGRCGRWWPKAMRGARTRAPADAGAALRALARTTTQRPRCASTLFGCARPHDPLDAAADHRPEHRLALRQ